MNLGTGIFLGLVFLGLVILYTKNRDTINMKKILKWIGIVFGSIILLFALIYLGFYLKDKYDSRPQVITEFKNIKIGDTMTDVKFKVGKITLDKKSTSYRTGYLLPTDGIYNTEDSNLSVDIVDNKVETIYYDCGQYPDFTSFNGIACGNPGETILSKFGNEVEIRCLSKESKDYDHELIRYYSTNQYNVRYYLEKDKVVGFSISNYKTPSSTGNWKECK